MVKLYLIAKKTQSRKVHPEDLVMVCLDQENATAVLQELHDWRDGMEFVAIPVGISVKLFEALSSKFRIGMVCGSALDAPKVAEESKSTVGCHSCL